LFYKVICVFFEQGNKLNIKQLINQRIFILLFYFLITFFFGVGISSGQELTLKGRVVNNSKQPIEFIHATLLKNDSIYVEGTAYILGNFSFKAQKGNYRLILEQFGAEYFNDTLDLKEDLDLGEIEIDESVALESIITITAGKKLIEQKVDRLVFNMEECVYAMVGNV